MTFPKLLAQSLLWRGLYFITLFGVNIVLSRNLQASGSGTVFYIANTFAFVQLVAGLSLENGITFFGAGKQIPAHQLLWLCLLWTLVLVVFQLIFFRFFSFSFIDSSDGNIPMYAFFFITGLLLTTYGSNLFYAAGNFFLPNLLLSCCNLLFIVFVYTKNNILSTSGSINIEEVYFFLFLLQGLSVIVAYIVTSQSWRGFELPDWLSIKRLLRYSSTVLLFNVLLFAVYRVDYYFVHYSPVCTRADLGNYIQASKLGQMLLVVPQIIGSAVYPQVSSGEDIAVVSRIISLLIKVMALVFLLLFFVVLLIGSRLFPFLFGETFGQVQVPFLLLLPGIYGLAVISFFSNFFSGQGNVKISVRAALLALVVVVTGDFLFVGNYGIIAAAIVSSIGYLVMFTPYLLHFRKISGVRLKSFFRFRKEDIELMKAFFKKEKRLPDNQ